jgi:TolB-like protein
MLRRLGSELKRRRVLNTAVIYVVAAWLALQVVEVLSDAGLPPDFLRILLAILVAGFPIALIGGWFFDISREGISKTPPCQSDDPIHRLTFLDYGRILGLLLALVVSVYVLVTPVHQESPDSIAVLGFDESVSSDDEVSIGDVLSEEIRRLVSLEAPLKVIGPTTSRVLHNAGDDRIPMARELALDFLMDGSLRVSDGNINIDARIITVDDGLELWSASLAGPLGEARVLQQQLVDMVVDELSVEPFRKRVTPDRIRQDLCSKVYDRYLQAKQLISSPPLSEARRRGVDLLEQIVEEDPDCAVAWGSLARTRVNWSEAGFARAGSAARRALEIDDRLADAWAVLAEIAEEERRWIDSESYFHRALEAEPSNAFVNEMYAESLMARGRVSDATRYALRAYELDPASRPINWHLSMAATMNGDFDLSIKHMLIADRLSADAVIKGWMSLAVTYARKGEESLALEILRQHADMTPPWTERCMAARHGAEPPEDLVDEIRRTNDAILSGEISGARRWYYSTLIISCATWAGAADFLVGQMRSEDVPTEARWFPFFFPDASILRQHPGFREMVIEDGLLEYWQEVGWSDYCEPAGEADFRCD